MANSSLGSVLSGTHFNSAESIMALQNQTAPLFSSLLASNYVNDFQINSERTPYGALGSNDHLAFCSQSRVTASQLGLSQHIADYRRGVLDRFTMNYFRQHIRRITNLIQFESSLLLESLLSKDPFLISFEEAYIENQFTILNRNPGLSRVAFNEHSLNPLYHPLMDPNSSLLRNDIDFALRSVSMSLPEMNNSVFPLNQQDITDIPNCADFRSYQFGNPYLPSQHAQIQTDQYFGPIRSGAMRTRNNLNTRRNYGPYKCRQCQREFAVSQCYAAHKRWHCRTDYRPHNSTSSESVITNSELETFQAPVQPLHFQVHATSFLGETASRNAPNEIPSSIELVNEIITLVQAAVDKFDERQGLMAADMGEKCNSCYPIVSINEEPMN